MRNSALIRLGVAACLLGTAQLAYAQETETSAQEATVPEETDAQADPQSAQSDAPKGLDEIIVTAQKRAQDIRDVPISMTVVDVEEIKERNIENLNDLDDIVPNVTVAVTPTVSFIFFRGLGSGLNRGFETSVGVFNDGMYLGRPSFFSNAFIDLGHAEILRGPQGTLFGKNTVAGALQLNTVVPNEEWGGYVDVMGGEREHARLRAAINAPFFDDQFMVRLAVARDKRDGHVYNTTLDRFEGDTDNTDAQLRLRYKPTNAIDVNFKVRYSDVYQGANGTAELSTGPDDPNIGLFQLFDPKTETNPDFQTSLDHPGFVERETFEYMLQADVDMWDHTFTFIGTHAEYEEYNESDVDFSPIPGLVARFPETYNQQSIELRVLSPERDFFEYVAGVYFFKSDVNVLTVVDAVPLSLGSVLDDYVLPPVLQALLSGVAPSGAMLTAEQQLDYFDQVTTSYAAFGQATAHLSEKLDLIIGLRFSYDHKNLNYRQEFTNTKVFFDEVAGFDEFDLRDLEKSETDFSPKVSLLYAITDEIKAYGTIAKGFKGGGFNESSATADEVAFDAESAVTFEGGVKGRFLGGFSSFAIGVFWTEFDNLQTSTYNGSRFIVSNAAKAVTRGVEWEIGAILGEGLFVGTNGGYTDAFYRDYKDGPCPVSSEEDSCDLTGKRLSPAPKWNGSAIVGYEFNVMQSIKFMVGADIIYVSAVNSTDHDPIDASEGYVTYNGRMGLKDADGLWSFTVYGKNLSDEVVLLGAGDSPLWAGSHFGSTLPGRTIDAEFRVNF